ncbi:hypothetical protein D3C71_1627930 [compost metagenome]
MPANRILRDRSQHPSLIAHQHMSSRIKSGVLRLERIRHIVALGRMKGIVQQSGEIRAVSGRRQCNGFALADPCGPFASRLQRN